MPSSPFFSEDAAAAAAEWARGMAIVGHKLPGANLLALLRPLVTFTSLAGVVGFLAYGLHAKYEDIFPEASFKGYIVPAAAALTLAVAWQVFGFHSTAPRKSAARVALSRALEGGRRAAKEGLPRRNALYEDLLTGPQYMSASAPRTIPALFTAAMQKFGAGSPALGTRPVIRAERQGRFPQYELGEYKWRSFGEVWDRARRIGSGLVNEARLTAESRVMIYANTCEEWLTSMIGATSYGMTVCTAYSTLGLDALAFIMSQTETPVVFADMSLLPHLVDIMNGRRAEDPAGEPIDCNLDHVRLVVTFNDREAHEATALAAAEHAQQVLGTRSEQHGGPIRVITLDQLMAAGEASMVDASNPSDDDLAVIMYTSGSTSMPKGVMVTHGNLVSAVGGLAASLPEISPQDTLLAYLPLSHILEMVAELTLLANGSRVGYGSPYTLSDSSPSVMNEPGLKNRGDAPTLAPTVMAGVPAVWDKVRAGLEGRMAKSAVLGTLFNLAMFYKLRAVAALADAPFFNALLFDKIRTMGLGGRVRMIISGGGPLSGDTQAFMEAVFCCPVRQGYGLTETCGCGTIQWCSDNLPGRVGVPTGATDIKLVDWDEYTSAPTAEHPRPQGEICISGPAVARGYYLLDDKTAQDFKQGADGRTWFSTGDIGEWTEDGVLRIIDRKKDLVKLSKGEYVSLGKVEAIMKGVALLENLCLYADSTKDYCVAVVVPNPVVVRDQLGIDGSREELAENETVRSAILQAMQAHGKASKLARFEIPKKITLAREEWTPQNEMLTASMKLKRKPITRAFQNELDALYRE